jgi:hypothetical protein
MECPKVEIGGKKVIILSGYVESKRANSEASASRSIRIEAINKLRKSAHENPDAVAFGYTAGRWIPAA